MKYILENANEGVNSNEKRLVIDGKNHNGDLITSYKKFKGILEITTECECELKDICLKMIEFLTKEIQKMPNTESQCYTFNLIDTCERLRYLIDAHFSSYGTSIKIIDNTDFYRKQLVEANRRIDRAYCRETYWK